jgi:hypothetical protein
VDKQLDDALEVLGVAPGSDRETVARAYRRLARATHPDVSPGPEAAQRFAAVTAAYRLVSGMHVAERDSRRPSEGVAHDWATPASVPRGFPLLLGASPLEALWSWSRPPIVAGPAVIRSMPRDAGASRGHGIPGSRPRPVIHLGDL